MQAKLFSIIVLTFLSLLNCKSPISNVDCYAPVNLIMLSEKDLIERAQKLTPKNPYVVFKNCGGSKIDSNEMNRLNNGELTTDKYVNEKGVIIEEVVREITEEDEMLQILVEEAYGYEDPFPFVKINCDSLEEILTAVYRSDQGKRTINVPESEINDPFEDKTTVVNIIRQCGIPNKNDISENALIAIFYVFQHSTSDIMAAYYPYIRESASSGNMKLRWLAMMKDRLLLSHEKQQIYGTQYSEDPVTNKTTLSPLRNPEMVNKRREEMGMGPIERERFFKRIDQPLN